jgi:hypothetical protein
VAACIQGPRESVERMLERLRIGPLGASVRGVSSEETTLDRAEDGFRIAR